MRHDVLQGLGASREVRVFVGGAAAARPSHQDEAGPSGLHAEAGPSGLHAYPSSDDSDSNVGTRPGKRRRLEDGQDGSAHLQQLVAPGVGRPCPWRRHLQTTLNGTVKVLHGRMSPAATHVVLSLLA